MTQTLAISFLFQRFLIPFTFSISHSLISRFLSLSLSLRFSLSHVFLRAFSVHRLSESLLMPVEFWVRWGRLDAHDPRSDSCCFFPESEWPNDKKIIFSNRTLRRQNCRFDDVLASAKNVSRTESRRRRRRCCRIVASATLLKIFEIELFFIRFGWRTKCWRSEGKIRHLQSRQRKLFQFFNENYLKKSFPLSRWSKRRTQKSVQTNHNSPKIERGLKFSFHPPPSSSCCCCLPLRAAAHN